MKSRTAHSAIPAIRPAIRATIRAGSTLGMGGLMVTVLLSACSPARAQLAPSPAPQVEEKGTLQVSGQAQIQVPADRTSISFGVETESSSAEEASRDNAAGMDAVFRALRALGIQGLELETYGYSLVPQYDRSRTQEPSIPTISGYRATNQIRVTLPGTDRAGEVLDAGIGAGANRVVNLSFQASDTREARLRALEMAVEAAREEAGTIADAMDLELGHALEIRGGASAENPRPQVMAAYRMAEEASRPTPIEAGGQTVSANVTIIFRILENAP